MNDQVNHSGLRVGVYADAFNIYYGARGLCGRSTPGWRWLDLPGLAMGLINPQRWPNAHLSRFVYCTAPRDRTGDPSSLADQQIYISALQHSYPRVMTVAYGKYVPRTKSGVLVDKSRPPRRIPAPNPVPSWLPAEPVIGPDGHTELLVSVTTFEEKGSDVNVASHLLTDVLTRQIDVAMVLSNDSDLQLPLQIARHHVPVATINPTRNPTANGLKGVPQEGAGGHWWRRLQVHDFLVHQLPDPVGPCPKPKRW